MAYGVLEILGLGKFSSDLETLEAFGLSLGISFLHAFFCISVSDFCAHPASRAWTLKLGSQISPFATPLQQHSLDFWATMAIIQQIVWKTLWDYLLCTTLSSVVSWMSNYTVNLLCKPLVLCVFYWSNWAFHFFQRKVQEPVAIQISSGKHACFLCGLFIDDWTHQVTILSTDLQEIHGIILLASTWDHLSSIHSSLTVYQNN